MTALRSCLRFAALAFVLALVATACSTSSTTTTSTTADAADSADTSSASDTTDSDADADASADADDTGAEAATQTEEDAGPEAAPEPTATPEPEPTEAPAAATSSSIGSDDDFCRVARELDENDPFEDADLDPFSPEFFEAASSLYESLLAIAPDEISGDIAIVRDELGRIGDQLEAIDYDFTDPAFGEVMETLDGGAVEDAGIRIEDYLRDACGIDVDAMDEVEVDDLPALGLDDDALAGLSEIGPEEAALLLGQLNLDPELQACLLEKLPELTASQDPAILTQEICGTTLLDILSGLGG